MPGSIGLGITLGVVSNHCEAADRIPRSGSRQSVIFTTRAAGLASIELGTLRHVGPIITRYDGTVPPMASGPARGGLCLEI